MTWKDEIKKKRDNLRQGPLQASHFKNRQTAMKEINDAWEKRMKQKRNAMDRLYTDFLRLKNRLGRIVDDLNVPKSQEYDFKEFLETFADAIERMADVNAPSSSDWTPDDISETMSDSVIDTRRMARARQDSDREIAERARRKAKDMKG